jgi:hypothetical protein
MLKEVTSTNTVAEFYMSYATVFEINVSRLFVQI